MSYSSMDPLKEQLSITQVLKDIAGVNIKRGQFQCWLHSDSHPSGRVGKDDKHCRCFQCNSSFDIYDIVSSVLNLPFVEAKKFLYQYYGLSEPDMSTKEVKRQVKKIRVDREIEQAFNAKVDDIYSDLAAMHRAIFRFDNGQLDHIGMQLYLLMDELQDKDPKIRIDAVRSAEAWWGC